MELETQMLSQQVQSWVSRGPGLSDLAQVLWLSAPRVCLSRGEGGFLLQLFRATALHTATACKTPMCYYRSFPNSDHRHGPLPK